MTKTEEFSNALNAYRNIDVPINKTLRLIGISAIKKQIPMKAIEIKRLPNAILGKCPICEGHSLKMRFCQNCGQALDWGEQNE